MSANVTVEIEGHKFILTPQEARSLHRALDAIFAPAWFDTPTAREVVHGDKPSIFGQEGFDYIDGLVKAANKEKGAL